MVGHVLAKVAALVGHHHHIVFAGLGEQRHFRLGATALVVVEAPGLFFDDLVAEALGGAAQRLGIGLVLGGRAGDQQPAVPAPHGEELAQRVGEHAAAGQGVQHVGQAAAAAQFVGGAAGVDQQAVGQGLGELAQRRGWRIDHEQAQAVVVQPARFFQQLLGGIAVQGLQLVAVLEKAPRGVAVGNGQLGPALPGIGRLGNYIGKQRTGIGAVTQITDTHGQFLGRHGMGHCGAACEDDQPAGVLQEMAHGGLLWRCGQHRNPVGAGEYAESTSRCVPR